MQQKSWMGTLASHYEDIRRLYHEDRLMILFDIDGTILDMRYMVLFVLKAFDKEHKTHFFQKLQLSDITVHENQVDHLLKNGPIPPEMQSKIIDWYYQRRWSPEYVFNAHRPFSGVWGYPFNRSYHMFSAWRILALASTTRARLASFKPGFEPMRTAWTTSNGCGGPTASSVRVAATKAVGAWAMAASCVRRVRHAVR